MRVLLAVAILLSGALLTLAAPAFVATDLKTGAILLCRPLATGEQVALVFTHSMYGGDVREEYAIRQDGRLRRVEMTTANAAAAEYYAYDGRVTRIGDRFRVDAPPAAFDEIVVRVDRVGQHRLVWDGGDLDLLAATGGGGPVGLSVDRGRLMDRFIGRSC